MPAPILQPGPRRRRRRRAEPAPVRLRKRRDEAPPTLRRLAGVGAALLALAAGFLGAFLLLGGASTRSPARTAHHAAAAVPLLTTVVRAHPPHAYGVTPDALQLHPRIGPRALRSGLLFDVRTGRVLWARDPHRLLPIASLTKMMTAIVTVNRAPPQARVLITTAATHFTGSGVGLLPLHKRVPLETLLYGLLLPSGNDAAIALAQHVAGNQRHFIGLMNATARAMHLTCTHFTTVSGIVDAGNYSCAADLAVMAHAVLRNRRLAHIVGTRNAALPFPIKGGKLYLFNNNPLLVTRYPGADGVKTGFTDAAGRCLVATARRGGKWFGVVLLHSKDPPTQAAGLLNAAFRGAIAARR